jgi:hypothetical protein
MASSNNNSTSTLAAAVSWKDSITAMSHRVTVSGLLGGIAGTALAVYRGHHQKSRTALLTGFSWALVATTLFGTERILKYGIRNAVVRFQTTTTDEKTTIDDAALPRQYDYLSYGLSGILGGMFLGGAYIQRPLRGAAFFTPIMILLAMAEHQWEDHRRQRQMEYYASTTAIAGSSSRDDNDNHKNN